MSDGHKVGYNIKFNKHLSEVTVKLWTMKTFNLVTNTVLLQLDSLQKHVMHSKVIVVLATCFIGLSTRAPSSITEQVNVLCVCVGSDYLVESLLLINCSVKALKMYNAHFVLRERKDSHILPLNL